MNGGGRLEPCAGDGGPPREGRRKSANRIPVKAISTLNQPSITKKVLPPLGVAALIVSAGPIRADAFEPSIGYLNPTGNGHAPIVLAEVAAKPKAGAKIRREHVILEGYDLVAYFRQERAVRGNPNIVSTYHGATYLFATKKDKEAFDKNPAKYEPQYGGFCASSLANGRRQESDPNQFHIQKGKLYVCTTAGALDEFKKNPDAHVEKADRNWLTIGPETYNTLTMEFESPWPFGPVSNQ